MATAGFAGLVTVLGRAHVRAGHHLNELRFRSRVEPSRLLYGAFPQREPEA